MLRVANETEFKGKKYFEVDFTDVMANKAKIIKDNQLDDKCLVLIGCDLNEACKFDDKGEFLFESLLRSHGFNTELPTLILAECCLMYLTVAAGDALIRWSNSIRANFCAFDPIVSVPRSPSSSMASLNGDSFGEVMMENFMMRGFDPVALRAYPSRDDVTKRFSRYGNPAIRAYSMFELETKPETTDLFCQADRRTLRMKAQLDEYEEWTLMAEHYLFIFCQK